MSVMAIPLPPAKVGSRTPAVVNRMTANAVVGPGVLDVLLLQSARTRQAAMSGRVIRRSNFRFISAPFAERSLVQSGHLCALQFVTLRFPSLDQAFGIARPDAFTTRTSGAAT